MKHASLVFGLLALVCLATAVFHGVAMADGDAARHLTFAGINVALAVGLWLRPRWLAWPLAALVVQQLWSHGHDLIDAAARGAVDWVSIGVIIVMPTMLALVIVDRRAAPPPRGGA